MKKCLALAVCMFAHCAANAAPMWEEQVHDGVTVYEYALEKPRTMKVFVARIDLTTPGISFTATERLKDGWREPIRTDDTSTDGKFLAETLLESTADFMMRRRASGTNVVLAANAAFWKPWPKPANENRADPIGLCIEDGEEVSAVTTDYATGTFVVYRDGKVDIVPALDADQRSNTAVAVSGFPIIMKDGKFTHPDDDSVHPRTAFGLSADKKKFVIVVVDGRQKGYSEGASLRDLHDIMLRLGVADAVNMDGGGSSTLVVFDAEQGGVRMLNQQPGGQVRDTAVNLGIAFSDAQGQGSGESTQDGNDAWLDETASSLWTGEWSQGILYGADGRGYIDGANIFTPYNVSTGNVVTVETKAQFYAYVGHDTPDATAQAAVRLGTNGCFQVWTKTGNGEQGTYPSEASAEGGSMRGGNGWVDVVAEGVTPVSGEEYTLRTTFDYTANIFSVEVRTGLTGWTRFEEKDNPVNPVNPVKTSFPLAASTNCVSSIAFVGDTLFASLYGECRYEIIGFVADEALALSNNVEIVLSAAKAAWLNKCGGDKAAVQLAASGLSAKDLDDAYLLNLDITDGSRSYAFAITDIDVGDTSVTVAVTLTRSGKIAQAINGTFKFYGAATLAGFKTAPSPLGSAVLSDEDFSEGDSATATILLDGETPPAFFKAKIEE